MSSRSDLKNSFSTGNQATPAIFANLIDSTYNTTEDSLLLGPVGYTGSYGLIGPIGGTYVGLFISSKTENPTPSSPGILGETFFSVNGPTAYGYFCIGTDTWIRLPGSTAF
jgi:hypothetical protein